MGNEMESEESVRFVVDLGGGHSVSFGKLLQARALIRFATARGHGCRLYVHSRSGEGTEWEMVPISEHEPASRLRQGRAAEIVAAF